MKTDARLFIGLDVGTSSSKAVAWTVGGQAVATGHASTPTRSPEPGRGEQDARHWSRSAAAAVRRCVRQLDVGRVAALGITVQRETFVLLDAHCRPLAPAVLWFDARGAPFLDELAQELGPDAYAAITGKQLDVTAAAGKLRWFSRHRPAVLEHTRYVADVLAYVCRQFTGQFRSTYAGADTTGLVNLATTQWHEPYITAAGLDVEQLPALVPPGSVLGHITAGAARRLRLPAGLPVIAAGGDGQCFALGAGRGRRDTATLTLGTSGVLGLPAEAGVLTPDGRTCLTCLPGQSLLEAVTQCGSATVSWLHDTFLTGRWPARRMREMEAACAAIAPGCEGLLVLPHWRGVRAPHNDPLARGVTVGWTDRHTAAHLQRAIMEGIALEVTTVLRRVCTELSLPVRRLVIGGGGAASDTWCRIFADAAELPCLRPETLESASLGAAILAMSAIDPNGVAAVLPRLCNGGREFLPDPANAAVYATLRELQATLYTGTRRISHELGRIAARPGRQRPRHTDTTTSVCPPDVVKKTPKADPE